MRDGSYVCKAERFEKSVWVGFELTRTVARKISGTALYLVLQNVTCQKILARKPWFGRPDGVPRLERLGDAPRLGVSRGIVQDSAVNRRVVHDKKDNQEKGNGDNEKEKPAVSLLVTSWCSLAVA